MEMVKEEDENEEEILIRGDAETRNRQRVKWRTISTMNVGFVCKYTTTTKMKQDGTNF